MIVPLSLFGSVPIAILQYDDEPADWTPDLRIAHFHYPGSTYTETQLLGQSLLEVDHLVHLTNVTDFQALYALFRNGGLQSLKTPVSVSVFAGNQTVTEGAGSFSVWNDVRMTAMTEVQRRFDGTVQCRCTFARGPGV